MQIYTDEITQSFLTEGNVFIKLSAVSGDLDGSGIDIKNHVASLIVPLSRFSEFSKNIQKVCDIYISQSEVQSEKISDNETNLVLFGQSLRIPP